MYATAELCGDNKTEDQLCSVRRRAGDLVLITEMASKVVTPADFFVAEGAFDLLLLVVMNVLSVSPQIIRQSKSTAALITADQLSW
jgi:hypothetical protein